jgi:hypothetical protein
VYVIKIFTAQERIGPNITSPLQLDSSVLSANSCSSPSDGLLLQKRYIRTAQQNSLPSNCCEASSVPGLEVPRAASPLLENLIYSPESTETGDNFEARTIYNRFVYTPSMQMTAGQVGAARAREAASPGPMVTSVAAATSVGWLFSASPAESECE